MIEYLCSHVIFHLCTHNVSDVRYVIVRCKLDQCKRDENDSHDDDLSYCCIYVHIGYICGNIADHKRDHKTYDRRKESEEHIETERSHIWLIIADHFF